MISGLFIYNSDGLIAGVALAHCKSILVFLDWVIPLEVLYIEHLGNGTAEDLPCKLLK